MYSLNHANVLEWAATYDGEPFHALITDPPYHLTSITERFGKQGSAPAQFGKDGAFQRASRGFMNAQWDGGDVAFRPETWYALAQHLHPGAFGMAFASTRGLHRMMVAIEDAGLIIHPVIFCWGFGSGFPKATRIDTTVDRMAGASRAVVRQKAQTGAKFKLTQGLIDNGGFNDPSRAEYDITAPATPLAAAWAGHRYGLQALKPALEPIIVFQRPYQGKPVECITRTGAGALWIDGGRISAESMTRPNGKPETPGWGLHTRNDEWTNTTGRWPANLILSHTPRCDDSGCADDCPVKRIGEQSGESASKRSERGAVEIFDEAYKGNGWIGQSTECGHDDSGTAARFFFNADYAYERLESADPVVYVPKASTAEREAGLHDFAPTTVNDGRDTPIDNPYQRGETQRRNTHPTIKPISLIKHLAALLLPPVEYAPRRILVPFSGAGSEMIACHLAGWESITGIELEAAHVEIARHRLEWWTAAARATLATEPDAILDKAGDKTAAQLSEQLTLFDIAA